MRHPRLLALFAFLLFTFAIVSVGGAAGTRPPIEWNPAKVEYSIGNGAGPSEDLVVTVTSWEDLSDVDLWVVPELANFVTVTPDHFTTMTAGTPYPVRLRFSVAPGAIPQVYSGTIHLRVGTATIPLPLPVSVDVDYGDLVIPPTTKVLTQAASATLITIETTPEGRALTFSDVSPEITGLAPGDVLVLNTCTAAPMGFLGRVIGVETTADGVVVLTGPATLEDAISEGTVLLDRDLGPDDVAARAPGQTGGLVPQRREIESLQPELMAEPQMLTFYVDDLVLYDADGDPETTADQLMADGSIGVGVGFDFSLGISGGQVRHFRTVVQAREEVELTLHLDVPLGEEFQREKLIGEPTYYSSIVVWAGFVPLVFVPQLRNHVEFEGSASAGIETKIIQDATLTLGVQYDDGSWSPVSDFTPNLDWEEPQFTLGCEVKGSIGPQFNLLLYGVVGPYVEVDGYAQLNVDLLPALAWELYGGVEASAGARVDVLGRTLVEEEFPTLVGFRTLLAHWEQPNLGTVAGQVTDAVTHQPLAGVAVEVRRGDGTLAATASTNAGGAYSVSVAAGEYRADFSKSGYLAAHYFGVDVVADQTTYLETVLQIDTAHSGPGIVAGHIYNALSGAGVAGVGIDLRAGINTTTGAIVTSTTTGIAGAYRIQDLAAGNYTAEVRGGGYLTTHFGVICIGGQETAHQDATITPILPPGQTRIVLTWGAWPYDLDSHTTGPLPDGGRFHMYYPYAQANGGSPWPGYVQLDLDDVTSYGPETTTLLQQLPGVYRFMVHDYTNRYSGSSTALSSSGALVRVYREEGLVHSFPVPTGQGGTLWTVFEMDGNTITPVNSFSYTSNPGGINLLASDEPFDWSALPAKEGLGGGQGPGGSGRDAGAEGAASGVDEATPVAFALHPVAPNPVSGPVTIRFDLPTATTLCLEVHDAQGRVVRRLTSGEQAPAGRRAVIWDGRGERGEALQPGVYFVRFQAGGYQATRRAVVMR